MNLFRMIRKEGSGGAFYTCMGVTTRPPIEMPDRINFRARRLFHMELTSRGDDVERHCPDKLTVNAYERDQIFIRVK